MESKKENNTSIPPNPSRTCDVVMKGGITSGIVYPKAIYQMATDYRFVNIGGTSAGAIAASLTAAAEYNRRENQSCSGFEILNNLPTLLSENVNGKSRLFSLFQPNKSTRKIFNAIFHIAGKKNKFSKGIFSASSLIYHFPFISFLALIPGALMMYFLWNKINDGLFTITITITALLTLVLMLVSTLISFGITFNKILSKNYYGLTTGNAEKVDDNAPPLTVWLADMIDKVAGNKDPLKPLTFGDLKNVKDNRKDSIILQMMTTNVTWRRPHTLPFTDALFYFDESEFKTFFPKRVVDWIVSKSNKESAKHGKIPLPDFDDMPIVVGARMSLSFPILISAVPLYAIDYTLANNKKGPQNTTPEKCLFSDGGICSNFPIHFFDSPIPGRPTFAFNLDEFHPEHPQQKDESKNIYLTNTNGDGVNDKWFRFDDSLLKFLKSLMNTMQNWTDHTQVKMPGYRDRIVSIHLSPDEGGLNLNMPEEVITHLSERGMYAGELLRDRFTGTSGHPMDWNNHRWIRYRTTMCMLENYLKNIEKKFEEFDPNIEKGYEELLHRANGEPPQCYEFTNDQREFAIDEMERLREYIQRLNERMYSYCSGSPRPAPELKAKPKI
ncbi:MAG: patatin-like phospholipase family protein [Bacteroidetes bacterium]|nr:patatin-like phospholipase family protein [Bacteroidota bacterium]